MQVPSIRNSQPSERQLTETRESFERYVSDPALQQPRFAMILGTGMGGVAEMLGDVISIPYEQLPGFSPATITGHGGELLSGWLNGQPVVAMNGRSHFYEGRTVDQIRYPIWFLQALGVEHLVIGNASGGIHPRFRSGEVMLISDQLDLMFRPAPPVGLPTPADDSSPDDSSPDNSSLDDSPLDDSLPADLSDRCRATRRHTPYCPTWIEAALRIGRRHNLVLHSGTYAALTGPNYETRAEYRMLRKLGADVVGMSTIPEANLAADLGLSVCGLSTITNVAKPDIIQRTTHDEVIAAVQSAEATLRVLIHELVAELA